ncbi:MAG: penicillin-insensitive murein endopeptidase [Myxococcota bacterium]|nr:penicillin-insensitive murein endopeptidase [Myxococcota bacterium]
MTALSEPRGRRHCLWALCVLTLALVLLLPRESATARSVSKGTPQDGELLDGFQVPLTGEHHAFAPNVRARGNQYTTLEAAALLARAARTVDEASPGAPLILGDCSARGGGALERHASHQSGRDLDLLFYVKDSRGRSIPSPGFHHFDGRGKCADETCTLRFDVARNWWLVRTLLASQRPAVQYIFISRPLADMMLHYARRFGEHPSILRRAASVLHQPRDAPPHSDHLHVRIYCNEKDLKQGCVDTGPRWRWIQANGRAKGIAP